MGRRSYRNRRPAFLKNAIGHIDIFSVLFLENKRRTFFMPKKPDPNLRELSPYIYVGEDKEGNPVGIEEESLLENGLLIIGSKNSGKEEILKKIAFYEVFAPFTTVDGVYRKPFSKSCATFIISKPDLSYYFYAIPKEWKRSDGTKLITPSTDMKVRNELLGMKSFDYDKINEILNFTKHCKNRGIAVIDMENFRYEEASVRAVGMLLLSLQISMHDTNNTGRHRHYLMIDDAWSYLPYLESILKYGPSYNLSTILTFDSRSQYKEHETLVENNLQNVLIMGNLRYEDAKYYSERFEIPLQELIDGGKDHFYLATYDKDMYFRVKKCFINDKPIDEKHDLLIAELGKKYKKDMMKASADEEYVKDIMLAYAKCIAEQNKEFELGTTKDSMQRVAKELDAKENAKKNEILKQEPIPQPEVQKPVQVEKTQPEEDDTSNDIQLIGAVKKTPVTPSTPPKQSQKTSASLDGLKALMGIVDNAPPRIQKQLKKEGFPVEEKKKQTPKPSENESMKPNANEKTQNAPKENKNTEKDRDTKNAESFNPFGKTMSDIARARTIEMPTYTQTDPFSKNQKNRNKSKNEQEKKVNNQQNPNIQEQQAQSHKKKKKKKKKKNVAQNVEQREIPKNTTVDKKLDVHYENNKHENVNEKAKNAVHPTNKTVVQKTTEPKKENVVVEVPHITPEIASEPETALVTPIIKEEKGIENQLVINQEDIVIEEECENTTNNTQNDKEQQIIEHKKVMAYDNLDESGDEDVNSLDTDGESKGEISEQIEEQASEVSDKQDEFLNLFEDDEDDDFSLFDSDDTEDIEMSKNGLRDDDFGTVGLSDKLATLSVQPRSSGEHFSKEEASANELIDKLKERGRNTNFFSKRREIELLKNEKNR